MFASTYTPFKTRERQGWWKQDRHNILLYSVLKVDGTTPKI